MCIGIPMQIESSVESSNGSRALCRDAHGQQFDIDTMLIGEQPAGTWVMTFLNTAREIISNDHAHTTIQALQALENVMLGESFEHLFADLIDREPELPDHLKPEHLKPEQPKPKHQQPETEDK